MRKIIYIGLVAINVNGFLSAASLASYDFTASDHLWTSTGNWAWASGAWSAGFESVASIATLTSPVMVLDKAGAVTVGVTHSYNFEYGFDGGRFEFTFDNGANWNVIAQNLFTANPYSATVAIGDYGQQIDGAVFTGYSGGPVTSYFTLGTGGQPKYETEGEQTLFEEGAEVQFRFLASWGNDDGPPAPNWQISTVTFETVVIPEPSHSALAALAMGICIWRRKRLS